MNKKKLILGIIFIFSLFCLVFSSYKLLEYKLESEKTEKILENITEIAELSESEEDSENETCEIEGHPCDDQYWKYLKTPFLSANISALKQENPDTVGWLQVLGTNINYPFVQAYNNDFYLYTSFDGSRNSAGWVFLDYRNSQDLTDDNNIIYAHGRLDNTMFGSLRNLTKSNWLENPDNYLIRTKTETSSSVWQIFSIYIIPTTSDYLQTSFSSIEEKYYFLNTLKSRSNHNFGVSLSPSDKILTLSTCYDDTSRMVVHAKLLKSQETPNSSNSEA
ncbi:class B sortase [Candidatus Saccharibacteria bacterium]|nr:class B sortase [Candidatus Saccharibacteria bacterium]